jgi:outer membrane putative beta-barrel porin/alpha-amylase
MSRQHSRQSGVPGVMLLSAGFVFLCGPTGWATEAGLDAAGEYLSVSRNWPVGRFAKQPQLTAAAFREDAAEPERAQTSSHTQAKRVDPNASVAPQVEVRVSNHGEFERVSFEWPEAIEYELVQHAEQVTVVFSRPGRMDLSRVADRLARVVEAWAPDGDVTSHVTLRVLPNTRVQSANLKDGRVAIDLFEGTAQNPAPPPPNPEHDTIEQLRRALEQRDAVIEQLLTRFDELSARFERLEQAVALSGGDLDRVTAGHAGNTPQQEATTTQGQGRKGTPAPERQETAQQQAPAPGQVEVDEEAAERALDFTLVQQGVLLLPFGRNQFTPSFTYTRRTGDFPVVVNGQVAEEDVRRNEFAFLASLFVGLPFDSQLELGLPYNLVEQKIVDKVLGTAVNESSNTGHGLGDFSVGLAKTVLREKHWWPDVVLSVNWNTGTGESDDNDVPLDGGFQELTGAISFTKRQDPLVFVGEAFYEAAFEHNDIEPGDTLGFDIGTFLAASPSTSLRMVLNQSFIDEFKVNGESINGSDQVQSILTFGASVILGRDVLLDGAVGIGLTDDSPDYSVSVSLPIRFSTPGF